MPWWGVLLIIVGVQAISLLMLWLLWRRSGNILESFMERLEGSTAKRLAEEKEVERKAKESIAAAYKDLAERQKGLDRWYNDNKAKIEEEAADAFTELAGDPVAVDNKLDELLGTTSTPTKEDPPGEG